MSGTIYAVGDIHGRLDYLDAALEMIARDSGTSGGDTGRTSGGETLVFVGDLVDRGPDSRGVIDRLMAGIAEGRDWTVLKGNHDRMFQTFLAEAIEHDANIKSGRGWLHGALGGVETLASYGVKASGWQGVRRIAEEAREKVPHAHLDFIAGLKLSHETERYFFAHAGIRPGVALDEQSEDDLLWIRHEFLNDPRPHPKVIVHGHTPEQRPENLGNRINTDGGAGYGRPIYPVVLEEDGGVFMLDGTGRVPM